MDARAPGAAAGRGGRGRSRRHVLQRREQLQPRAARHRPAPRAARGADADAARGALRRRRAGAHQRLEPARHAHTGADAASAQDGTGQYLYPLPLLVRTT